MRRWEQDEGMPVHRHLHRARGSVYAFVDELDRWCESRKPPGPTTPAPAVLRGTRAWLTAVAAALLGFAALAFALNRAAVASAPGATRDLSNAGRLTAPRPQPLPSDPQLREAFLVARHQLSRRTGDRDRARQRLEQVVEQAPDFADAHALLGEAYLRQALYEPPARAEAWMQAEACATRALALNADLAAAHTVLGRIRLLRDWNWSAAEAEINRAVELDPNDPEARSTRALYLSFAGRLDEAVAERERVLQSDPLNPQWFVYLGEEYTLARRYDQADRSFRRALELEHDYRPAVAGRADVAARAGRLDEAAALRLRQFQLSKRDDLAARYEEARRRDGALAAERWLDEQRLSQFSRDTENQSWNLGYTHARLGHREEALQFLQAAYERRDFGLLRARLDPDLDLLRGDPRLDDLLRRLGPPQ